MAQVLAGEAQWCVLHGDCRDLAAEMLESCVDAIVCDPPYELGFMSRKWDGSGVAFDQETWAAMLRVMKPGAHLMAFGGTRTMHRITCAIEDAGAEIRDQLAWLYASGFPKSLNVSKAIDAKLGAVRPVVGVAQGAASNDTQSLGSFAASYPATEPATEPATIWNGWGTAVKPATEPICMARKPLAGTVAENVLQHGTGALNIDGCRVAHSGAADLAAHQAQVEAIKSRGGSMGNSWKNSSDLAGASEVSADGRWPANVLLCHADDCKKLGAVSVPAHPTWDTPNRATEPTAFTGPVVSQVRHANGRNGEASADRRYADQGSTSFAPLPGSRRDDTETVDRWECVEGCPVRELAMQSGESRDGVTGARGGVGNVGPVVGGYSEQWGSYGGSGSAARYFTQFQHAELDDTTPFLYLAKAARSERDLGLEQFRARSGGEATGREDDAPGTINPRAGAGKLGGARNCHPTVKPIELLRWLIRLVTPKGGVVLDPFAGSGSCGVAALLEGRRYIGLELNDTDAEPFVSIARARLHHVEGREFIPRESLRSSEPPRQTALFTEVGT